jgi:hypothetical protein
MHTTEKQGNDTQLLRGKNVIDDSVVRSWLSTLPLYNFRDAMGIDVCGVYLIYDENERLLYVGESTCIGSRLRHYVGTENNGNLFWHLVNDESLVRILAEKRRSVVERTHHCSCGKMIDCERGDKIRFSQIRFSHIRSKVSNLYKGFNVRIGEFQRDDAMRWKYESACQYYLKPAYPEWLYSMLHKKEDL